jgi:hypothetical protein
LRGQIGKWKIGNDVVEATAQRNSKKFKEKWGMPIGESVAYMSGGKVEK